MSPEIIERSITGQIGPFVGIVQVIVQLHVFRVTLAVHDDAESLVAQGHAVAPEAARELLFAVLRDLVYTRNEVIDSGRFDLATGEVWLDANNAAISGLQVFSAGGSLLAADLAPEVLQFVISTNNTTYAEGAFANLPVDGAVTQTSTAGFERTNR